MPCSITTPRPTRSSRAHQRARRRRVTTPGAGSRATRRRRREITFSLITDAGEAPSGDVLQRLRTGHHFIAIRVRVAPSDVATAGLATVEAGRADAVRPAVVGGGERSSEPHLVGGTPMRRLVFAAVAVAAAAGVGAYIGPAYGQAKGD